jgi:hypothetical protein
MFMYRTTFKSHKRRGIPIPTGNTATPYSSNRITHVYDSFAILLVVEVSAEMFHNIAELFRGPLWTGALKIKIY